MHIVSLSFGADTETPFAREAGIVISVSPAAERHRVLVRGSCKLARNASPLAGLDVPHGIFLTTIDSFEQRPYTLPLVGHRLVFPEDVQVVGDEYLVDFCALVDVQSTMVGPYFLHGSFFEHVSNVVYVSYEREDAR